MNGKFVSTGLVVAVNAALLQLAAAHPGPVGHTHGDDWPFGVAAVAACALAAGLYGLALKIRDSRKPVPIPSEKGRNHR